MKLIQQIDAAVHEFIHDVLPPLMDSAKSLSQEVAGATRQRLATEEGARFARRAVATAIVGTLGLAALAVAVDSTASAMGHLSVFEVPDTGEPPPLYRPAPDWQPPTWYPEPERLMALQGINGEPTRTSRPNLNARGAFVYDLDSGEVLLAYNADERWPVASLTKLMTGLAAATEAPDLTQVYCVDERWYPTRNGARSKFSTGECYRGWDMLGSALVASDNRGAYGLQVVSGLPYEDFITRMNTVAGDLGMTYSTFSDPSGLEDDNLSTARDMARAVIAAAYHPMVSVAVNAPTWETRRLDAPGGRKLNTTNRLAGRSSVEVLAAKTGYTDTARYCYTALVRTKSGRRVALSVIGANRSSQRWSDVDRLLSWIERPS